MAAQTGPSHPSVNVPQSAEAGWWTPSLEASHIGATDDWVRPLGCAPRTLSRIAPYECSRSHTAHSPLGTVAQTGSSASLVPRQVYKASRRPAICRRGRSYSDPPRLDALLERHRKLRWGLGDGGPASTKARKLGETTSSCRRKSLSNHCGPLSEGLEGTVVTVGGKPQDSHQSNNFPLLMSPIPPATCARIAGAHPWKARPSPPTQAPKQSGTERRVCFEASLGTRRDDAGAAGRLPTRRPYHKRF